MLALFSLWSTAWRVLWSPLANHRGMATLNVATKTTWDAIVPEYWDKSIMPEADRLAIGSKLSGPDGSDAAIVENEDLSKQPGDQITFGLHNRLIGKGVTGTTALEGAEEILTVSTYVVTVDLVRHATAANLIARVESLLKWPVQAREAISGWLARFLDDDWVDQLLNQDTIQGLFAGDATSVATLGPGDIFLSAEMRRLHLAAERRGVRPFQTIRGGKMPFPIFCALMSEVDYYNLVNSDGFRQDVRLAALRGDTNPALSGAVDMYNGAIILRWSQVNPGDGMFGSFLRPEARLRTDMTAAQTTINIGPATVVTNVDYGQYFSASGASQRLLIDSEIITYTGGSSDPGDASWGTVSRAAAGTTAATHTAGALITQNNLGKVLFLGRNALMRAWALRPRRITQERDYAMESGLGIEFIYGVESVQNSDDTVANAVVMSTYSPNPNTV